MAIVNNNGSFLIFSNNSYKSKDLRRGSDQESLRQRHFINGREMKSNKILELSKFLAKPLMARVEVLEAKNRIGF